MRDGWKSQGGERPWLESTELLHCRDVPARNETFSPDEYILINSLQNPCLGTLLNRIKTNELLLLPNYIVVPSLMNCVLIDIEQTCCFWEGNILNKKYIYSC